MGLFLAVSAFRSQPVASLADAVAFYAATHGVECRPVEASESHAEGESRHDAFLFEPVDGWTVALWPGYFNIHDIELCRHLSRKLKTVASTVHVYDGDYWAHVLLDAGHVVDRFASVPDYFAESEVDKTEMRTLWAGHAESIAAVIDVPAESLAPYLVPNSPEIENRPIRAFHDDRFELADLWVFTDFWRRLGIHYPDDVANFSARLRFSDDYREKLPVSDEEL
jgi:hypothetical protein